jgi:hypothetical protein
MTHGGLLIPNLSGQVVGCAESVLTCRSWEEDDGESAWDFFFGQIWEGDATP